MTSTKKVLQSASMVSIGTAIGQMLAFAGSLVLVRLFSPAEMGVFTTITAVSSVVAPMVSGRLEMAIPLPKRTLDARRIAFMGIASSIFLSILFAIGLFLFGNAFGPTGEPAAVWWWALPAATLSLVVYLTFNQLAVRDGLYFALALRGVLFPALMTVVQVGLGLLHFGSEGLVIGLTIGHISSALVMGMRMKKSELSPRDSESFGALLRAYVRFPLFLGPSGSINALATQLPQIGLAVLFGMAVAGQFGMMAKILAVPVALIGQAVGYVYAGEIARARREGEKDVSGLFLKLTVQLSLVGSLAALLIILVGEPAFAWLLGEEWRQSGKFAQLFAISSVAQLIVVPLAQTLIIANRTGLQLMIDVARAMAILGTLLLAWVSKLDVEGTVLALAIVSLLGYTALWVVNKRASRSIVGGM